MAKIASIEWFEVQMRFLLSAKNSEHQKLFGMRIDREGRKLCFDRASCDFVIDDGSCEIARESSPCLCAGRQE